MTAEGTRSLGDAIVDDGIRWLNFFNGRVLSAGDLRADHLAIDRARRQLGRGIGPGVVDGLEVSEPEPRSASRPVIGVQPGLAIAADGHALELGRPIRLGLIRSDASTDDRGAAFGDCDAVVPGQAGVGAYVLTIGPASGDAGRALVAGLGADPDACSTSFTVEGVRFRLAPVQVDAGELGDPHLRNRLAMRLLGEDDARHRALVVEPFAARGGDLTPLDDLARACWQDDEVPLALVLWRPGEGIGFVDPWAVRRRTGSPSAAGLEPLTTSDAERARAQARYLQFEDQLRDLLLTEPDPGGLAALDRFEHLPPAGVVPLATAAGRGFGLGSFFRGMTVRGPVFINAAEVGPLLEESLAYPAVTLGEREVLWLYEIRENAQTPRRSPWVAARRAGIGLGELREVGVSGIGVRGPFGPFGPLGPFGPRDPIGPVGPAGAPAPSCVVFAGGHLRYRGDARFDLGRWSYANYAEIG